MYYELGSRNDESYESIITTNSYETQMPKDFMLADIKAEKSYINFLEIPEALRNEFIERKAEFIADEEKSLFLAVEYGDEFINMIEV